MNLNFKFFFLLVGLTSFFSCKNNSTNIALTNGLIINQSATIQPDSFQLNGTLYLDEGVITIEGKNLVVDFQGAVLQGSNDKNLPNEYYGLGVFVTGENIEIKNLNIRGFKIGLLAEDVKNLNITDSNFSYNYRPLLTSSAVRHSLYDTYNGDLKKRTHKKNKSMGGEMESWKEYGAGVYLKNCSDAVFKNNVLQYNNNGIVISNSSKNLIYNNQITYQSGFGIALENSVEHKIMHNFLDWNIRGYSFNYYKNTSGSGAFFADKKCTDNLIAFNSMTHSGENHFEKNSVYQNDFFPFTQDTSKFSKPQKVFPLPDGQNTSTLNSQFRGEKYILIDKFGPYNFEYPAIWLREISDNQLTFGIFGPEGNWKIVNGGEVVQTSRQSGSIPATVVVEKLPTSGRNFFLELEFIGVEFTDLFGYKNERGKTFKFTFTP